MSATAPLKSLTITAFRGSSQTLTLDFQAGKTLSLIYGENGTGKTTICDAFEFLASEQIGSLENRGLGSGLHKFWPTAGKQAGDVRVILETSAGTCSGQITKSKAVVSPAALRPRVEILRRQQVLKLIEAPPGKRYEEVKRFVDIEAYEKSEDSLRKLCASLKTDTDRAADAELQSLGSLRSFHEATGAPSGADPVAWARQELAKPQDDRRQEIANIAALRRAYDLLRLFPERLTKVVADLAAAQAAANQASQAHAAAVTTVSAGAEETLKVLEAGKAYFHRHADAAACPLCQSPDAVEGLSARIDDRIETLKQLQTAQAEHGQCTARLTKAQEAAAGLQDGYLNTAKNLSALLQPYAGRADVAQPAAALPSAIEALASWLKVCDSTAQTWEALENSWRGQDQLVAALRDTLSTYESNRDRLQGLKLLIPRAETALDVCVKARQAFTTGLIGEIAKEVGRLYEKVHPKEGLDKISFQLDPAQRASMGLHANFEGQDAPPQAYFSQSHLDTLGLCVFLALALREKAPETILILDDVLGSVDEPHVERVIDMIYEVSGRFRHTVVTTHYRPWREKYRWGWLKAGQCHFIELTTWRFADGMRMTTSMPEVARLKAMLACDDVDLQGVCGKAGVILEAMLDYLTLKYECRVPRRAGAAYTIGDLLPAVDKKLREALTIELRDCSVDPAACQAVKLHPILDELERIAQARNAFGAHFKAISFELLDQDALAFARAVEQLADALIDPEHGWPSNSKSGSYWRNRGDTRRLHPLHKPS